MSQDFLNEIPAFLGNNIQALSGSPKRNPYDQAVEDLVYDRKFPVLNGYGPISNTRFNEDANLLNQAQTPPVEPGSNLDFAEVARQQLIQDIVDRQMQKMMTVPKFDLSSLFQVEPKPNPLYYKDNSGKAKPRWA